MLWKAGWRTVSRLMTHADKNGPPQPIDQLDSFVSTRQAHIAWYVEESVQMSWSMRR